MEKVCSCGKAIGIRSTMCKSCVGKLQVHKFKVSKEELNDLVWNVKLPYSNIAKLFGVSISAIHKREMALGIEIRKGRVPYPFDKDETYFDTHYSYLVEEIVENKMDDYPYTPKDSYDDSNKYNSNIDDSMPF